MGDLIWLIDLYWRLGDTAGARGKFDEYRRVRPDATLQHAATDMFWATSLGDYERAEQLALERARLAQRPNATAANRQTALEGLRDVYAAQGRIQEMARTSATISAIGETRERPGVVIGNTARIAVYRRALGLPADSADQVMDRLMQERWQGIPPLDRPYNLVFNYLADRGDSTGIARLAKTFYREVPPDLIEEAPRSAMAYDFGRAALTRGQPAQALDHFRVTLADCSDCYMTMRFMGDAFHAPGQQDSAVAYYRRYLETPVFRRRAFDSIHRALVLERLAAIHDSRGEVDAALRYYGAFIQQWDKADAHLQPRVEAARRRVQQLRPG